MHIICHTIKRTIINPKLLTLNLKNRMNYSWFPVIFYDFSFSKIWVTSSEKKAKYWAILYRQDWAFLWILYLCKQHTMYKVKVLLKSNEVLLTPWVVPPHRLWSSRHYPSKNTQKVSYSFGCIAFCCIPPEMKDPYLKMMGNPTHLIAFSVDHSCYHDNAL